MQEPWDPEKERWQACRCLSDTAREHHPRGTNSHGAPRKSELKRKKYIFMQDKRKSRNFLGRDRAK